ncbi:MAG: hypothetical protein A2Y62_08550 [Candidatus Fischerbacteria bacterium RBG_13_37_8]|uniref:VCBS repeat-containing protein n=1 Tax=Candidatus Fischerbacteria bacterium RBG_13_37_8 TaxID=1817863 RepID=A0A1F5VXW3_9BACT|nr:MAG: hypothetical protein A2Y62_08550 [Candidatus Fischerbacteria bacterium RBG_13_37_8]
MEKHQPPIEGIAREEQPIFTGHMNSFRSESSSMDQLIGDINNDGIVDTILLPNAFSSIELPSARNISSYLGEPGGSIKIDPVTTELESPIFRTQGVLGNFIEDSPNIDLAITGLKANLYAAIRWRNSYVYTLSSEGANFQIFSYDDTKRKFYFKSEVMLGDVARSGSLDIDNANAIAVAANTRSLLFIDISDNDLPIIKSSISPKKRDFTHVRINETSAFALDSISELLGTASTLLRVFDITNVDNIYQGDGSGHFQSYSTIILDGEYLGSLPSDIAAGYFDDNNTLDIAVADFGLEKIYVLFGYGDGIFVIKTISELIKHPVKLEATDIDSDSNEDIVYISEHSVARRRNWVNGMVE